MRCCAGSGEWRRTGTGPAGNSLAMSAGNIEVARGLPAGRGQFVIDHPCGPDEMCCAVSAMVGRRIIDFGCQEENECYTLINHADRRRHRFIFSDALGHRLAGGSGWSPLRMVSDEVVFSPVLFAGANIFTGRPVDQQHLDAESRAGPLRCGRRRDAVRLSLPCHPSGIRTIRRNRRCRLDRRRLGRCHCRYHSASKRQMPT